MYEVTKDFCFEHDKYLLNNSINVKTLLDNAKIDLVVKNSENVNFLHYSKKQIKNIRNILEHLMKSDKIYTNNAPTLNNKKPIQCHMLANIKGLKSNASKKVAKFPTFLFLQVEICLIKLWQKQGPIKKKKMTISIIVKC